MNLPSKNILRDECLKLIFYFLKISGIPIILVLLFSFFHQDVWAEAESKKLGFVPVTLKETQWTLKPIDRRQCVNTCWDGRMKSGYSLGHYKSIWFNLDKTTGQLLAWCMMFWTMGNTALSRFVGLLYNGSLRWIPAFCLLCTVYPLFYGFWAGFGYLNDRFETMWYSQLYFTITELANAFLCYRFLDRSKSEDIQGNEFLPGKRPLIILAYWFMFCQAGIHLWQGVKDNIWDNLFGKRGNAMRNTRDTLFLSSDLGQFISTICGIWMLVSPAPKGTVGVVEPDDVENVDKSKDALSKKGFLGTSKLYTRSLFFTDLKYAGAYIVTFLFLLGMWNYKKEG